MRPNLLMLPPTLALLLLLAGCAGTAGSRPSAGSTPVPPGSVLTLHRPLELPGAGDFLYIQAGETLRLRDVQALEPHCYLETRSVPPPGYRVEPNRFTVTRVTRQTFYSGLPPAGGLLRVGNEGGDGSPTALYYISHFWLEPEKPTDVYRLTCQVDRLTVSAPPLAGTYVSAEEVRAALGGLFSLDLPAETAQAGASNRAMDSTWLVWGNMSMTPAAASR
jgi:hypothetical protein